MYKIGVLLPRSTFYPSMSFDIAEGIKAGFKHLNREDIEIAIENIGFGAEKQVCYQAAENLLLKENVQIVVAYVGQRTAQLLRPLFISANRLLIVLDAGANMPQEWPSSNNIIFHSLQDSLCCWMSAKLASRDGNKTGGMVTGYYDGGYLHTLAITQSFVNGGNTITFNHATGYTDTDFSMEGLSQHLEKNPDACLLSLFSGDFAEWYFAGLQEHIQDENPKIYTSSFLLEESMLAKVPYPNKQIKGVVAWSKELENKQNHDFIAEIEDLGRDATIFSLIAWEAAYLTVECIRLLDENKKKVNLAIQQLSNFQFEGPRGLIRFDSKSNHTLSPLYEAEIIADENGMSKLKIIGELKNLDTEFEEMKQLDLNGVVSGWFNSYACI